LNDMPIKAATTTVCALSIACCWNVGHALSYLLLSITFE
jgi:hypothetical protein